MTDEHLRALARRWAQTRAVDDEVAWLRERLRAGELSSTRLELAARLGHPAAAVIVAVKVPTTTRELLDGLRSEEVQRRVALAWLRTTGWEVVDRARRTLRLLEADLECRCPAHRAELASLPNPPYPADPRGRATARAARYAALAAQDPEDARGALEEVVACLAPLGVGPFDGVRAEVVPWALGARAPT